MKYLLLLFFLIPFSSHAQSTGMTLNSIVTPKSDSYALENGGDCNAYFLMSKGTAQTLTIPPDSTLSCPIGSEIVWEQYGAGELTLVAGSGVTINKISSTLIASAQHATGALKKVAANTWTLAGSMQ